MMTPGVTTAVTIAPASAMRNLANQDQGGIMEKRNSVTLLRRAAMVYICLASSGAALAADPATSRTFSFGCGSSTLTQAVRLLQPGDTLLVNGTCNESVLIPASVHDVTLDGQGSATISGVGDDAITIQGTGITIRGFTIGSSPQFHGILVTRGGSVTIENNLIQNSANGINLLSGIARIFGNTIQGNAQSGIIAQENSSARIGFQGTPNVIQSNLRGVVVTRSSSARIEGNDISNNQQRGIDVLRGSHADISGNTINGNGQHGVLVNYNSAVNFDFANFTTVNNGQTGVTCINSGAVDGPLGTLNGNLGPTAFFNSCVNNTQ
jgi:parallel beta-helix repeat protein